MGSWNMWWIDLVLYFLQYQGNLQTLNDIFLKDGYKKLKLTSKRWRIYNRLSKNIFIWLSLNLYFETHLRGRLNYTMLSPEFSCPSIFKKTKKVMGLAHRESLRYLHKVAFSFDWHSISPFCIRTRIYVVKQVWNTGKVQEWVKCKS